MNIVKLQQQLQNVPDNALIGYVQNPSGQVPSYLALTELNRRKSMREEYQQQAAPEKSVAEGMVEGVAGLPVNDQMFTAPETGIMAPVATAAAGGEVQGHAQEVQHFAQNYADGGEVRGYASGDLIKGLKPLTGPRDYSFKLPSLPSVPTTEQLQAYLADPQSYLADPKKYAEVAEKVGAPTKPVLPYAPNADPKAVAEKEATLLANRFKPEPQQNPAAPGAGGVGIGALQYKPMADNSAAYDQFQRPEQSAAEKMAEMQALIGEDAGKAGRAARLAKMEERTAKDEETAPWMALAKAGFGIAAGKSPFAISNIGEGAQAGLADLAASRERINNAKDKQFEIADRMAQAERAEKVAAAKYGVESSEAIKARNEQNKLAKLGYQNQRELSNYNREFEVQKGNADIALQKAKMAQDAAQHAQTIAMYDKRITASSGAAQAKLVGEKRKAYLDAQTILGPDITRMLKDKYSGNADDPNFQREKQMMINGYVSNALSLTMDDMDARDSGSL
jgi:hypothetical protein